MTVPAPAAPAVRAVAFCPAPPLLLPAVEGRPDPSTTGLRRACAGAVGALLAVQPELVVVVGSGAAAGDRFGPGDVGDLRGFGVPVEIPFAGRPRPGGRRVPLAHAVGAWLLDEAGSLAPRVGVGPAGLGQLLSGPAGPVAVLALGEGSARRTVKAPGYLDPAAAGFDGAVAAALRAGDAAALAGLDAAEGERLLASGVPTWRAVGEALRGGPVTARLLLAEAPFGVGYLVADWSLPDAGSAS